MCWCRSFLRTSASSWMRAFVLGVACGLEHVVLAAALDQEGDGAGALAEALEHGEPAGEPIALLGLGRVEDIVVLWRGELVLDEIEVFEEVRGRVDPAGDLGMSRELDQVLEALPSTVDDRADLKPPGFPQLVAQLEAVGRRRCAGEEVIRDGAEREDIEVLAEVGLVGDGLRRHVSRGRVLDQSIHMRRRRDLLGNLRAGRSLAIPDLPVQDLDARTRRTQVGDEDALGTEAPMNDLLLMGEPHDLRDLPH